MVMRSKTVILVAQDDYLEGALALKSLLFEKEKMKDFLILLHYVNSYP